MSDGVLICLLTHIIGVHSATDTSWSFVPDEYCGREWGYFPVKGHTGSHICSTWQGCAASYLCCDLAISEVSDVWAYVPAVMCAYTALWQYVQCQLG